jgi:hypothetical protein
VSGESEIRGVDLDAEEQLLPRYYEVSYATATRPYHVVVCRGCGRRWSRPLRKQVSVATIQYLVEHALDHRPSIRRRPVAHPNGVVGSGWSEHE